MALLYSFILLSFISITRTRCSRGCPKGLVALLFCLFLYYFVIVYCHNTGAHRAPPRGWWPRYFIFYFDFILVYFHNAHQVLAGLPQGVGDLAVFFYLILVYCHNTHQVLVPNGGGLATLFYFILN